MKIQIITGRKLKSKKDIIISDYKKPRALDEYDVNVLDLSHEALWRCEERRVSGLDRNSDLYAIAKMLESSEKAKNIIVYPQNIELQYDYDEDEDEYSSKITIKDIINRCDCYLGLPKCFPYNRNGAQIMFEPTSTKIDNNNIDADFHFINEFAADVITKSNISEKATTIKHNDDVYYTTLDICGTTDGVEQFINFIFEDNSCNNIPEWVTDYNFGTDQIQKEIICNNQEKIRELNEGIEEANRNLRENMHYKSILYTNGESLVKIVFEIIEKIFDCDLSDFKDEKREDFLIEKEEAIFVGEIKGVTSNVKNEHVSQLDVHCQRYIDNSKKENIEDITHGILIINPLRTKSVNEREPIHERQIELARRNGSLIIETVTLLRLFEMFQRGEITSEEIVKKMSCSTGLLKVTDLSK